MHVIARLRVFPPECPWAPHKGFVVSGEKLARLTRLVEEMERHLQRPLTCDEHRFLRYYVEATPEEEEAEADGASAG